MDNSAADAATDVKRPRPRRRGLRRWTRRLLLVLITAHIAYGVWYAVCKAELDEEIARIRARGEPLTLKESAPEAERTPEDRKVLEALASISGYSRKAAMALNTVLNGNIEFPQLPDRAALATLEATLRAHREALDCVLARAKQGPMGFPWDTTLFPWEVQLPHISSLKNVNRRNVHQIRVEYQSTIGGRSS